MVEASLAFLSWVQGTEKEISRMGGPTRQSGSWSFERWRQWKEEETCVTQRTLEIFASSFQRARLSALRRALVPF